MDDQNKMPTEQAGQRVAWEAHADRLAEAALQDGDPTRWFDELYAAGACGQVELPWSRLQPHPLLTEWASSRLVGSGRSALVVGCGLGADAEFIADLGFATTGFDVSPTAIGLSQERHRGSVVRYAVADLLDLPRDWLSAFDLVVEIMTIQALPRAVRDRAVEAVAGCLAPGGILLVVAARESEPNRPDGPPSERDSPPPWPLTGEELSGFTRHGLLAVQVEEITGNGERWRAQFQRPAPEEG